jgi:hypothetical protein
VSLLDPNPIPRIISLMGSNSICPDGIAFDPLLSLGMMTREKSSTYSPLREAIVF